jgi:hypothetical protein
VSGGGYHRPGTPAPYVASGSSRRPGRGSVGGQGARPPHHRTHPGWLTKIISA